MPQLNGRKVKLIRCVDVTHITGLGNVGPTIDNDSAKKKGKGALQMVYLDNGSVLCSAPGIQDFIIGGTYIKSYELDAEEKSKETKAK